MENSANAAAATGKTNRLIHEQSPYLLQHAHNPVDWYAWGEEAFAAAAAQDKPIFLSIGYSTCHWCHVMERESFENAGVAELLNRDFIAIKVDREERPEIDDLYMSATQMLTGQGGWPNSLWLTPDGRPFFAGTYFPPEDVGERPGFKSVLTFLAQVWREKRQDVLAQAAQISGAVGQMASARLALPGGAKLDRQIIDDVVDAHHRNFDFRLGGFGGAPKFPPHALLALVGYEMHRHSTEKLSDMLGWTLESMARGGIRDHLGGGFHRYSTDERWLVPHFEKMLYDNALLLRGYADAAVLMPDRGDIFTQAADNIAAWLGREMTGAQGGFYSALDADSEGEEGKFYLWTRPEIIEALGEAEGELFCRIYSAAEEGNFDDPATGVPNGQNILHLQRPIADSAKVEGLEEASLQTRLAAARERLLALRSRRVRPGRDDKIMTSWNALAITGLAYAGVKLNRPEYIHMAIRAAEFLLSSLRPHGRLGHIYREGEKRPPAVRGASTAGEKHPPAVREASTAKTSTATAGQTGYLEDYAYLAQAMLELYQATSERRWLGEAVALAEAMRELFADPAGGFYFTAADAKGLLARIRSPYDSATPSPNGVACLALIGLAEATGEKAYWLAAWGCLLAFGALLAQRSQGVETLTLALAEFLDRCPAEIQQECQDQRPQAAAQVVSGPVRLEVFSPAGAVKPGERVEMELHMTIAPPWHVASHDVSSEYAVPTEVTLDSNPMATLAEVEYPPGVFAQLAQNDKPMSIYQGSVVIRVPLAISPQAKAGPLELAVRVRFQACDDRCCQKPTQIRAGFSVTIG